jgi:formylglycine-generating enzyme required for sulfatase activity
MSQEAEAKIADVAERRRQAELKVARFERRFEPSYRLLACYAALPLVLTPELVHYLRVQFLKTEHVPWVAEADLLLSDLCYSVGYEQYAMDSAIRDYLVSELQSRVGQQKIEAVARLLIRYVQHLAKSNSYLTPHELQSQQWAAMVFIAEQRGQAVQQIARAYKKSVEEVEETGKVGLPSRAEMLRLSRITKELAPQINEYEGLMAYAKLISQVLAGPYTVEPEQFDHSYNVEGVSLALPKALRGDIKTPPDLRFPGIPNLEDFEYVTPIVRFEDEGENDIGLVSEVKTVEVANITIVPDLAEEDTSDQPLSDTLKPFEIQIKTIEKVEGEWFTLTDTGTAYRYIEPLREEVDLEMVAIPAGEFLMGSPEDEPERYDDESPQHHITVSSFFMGRYPVTQAQWRVVAGLPKVKQDLDADPSHFKGDDRPVENISWYDAVEFCTRLSHHTGREYRLPSEAEWEYACRAGTTTPFHFGEMITTEVANYDGSSYANGPKGENRGETTPVNEFGIANAFGLSDMHGNVYEWCLDHWHENYDGAPINGSAWLSEGESADRVIRGGSWSNYPRNCRSASRNHYLPGNRYSSIGFRVVVAPPGLR